MSSKCSGESVPQSRHRITGGRDTVGASFEGDDGEGDTGGTVVVVIMTLVGLHYKVYLKVMVKVIVVVVVTLVGLH